MPSRRPVLRLVVDTNIFVSALFSMVRGRKSIERTLFELIAYGPDPPSLIVSEAILDEYQDVFYRDTFRFGAAADRALEAIGRLARVIRPAVQIQELRDPDDTKFLEAYLDGGAHYLITRNKRDFPDWSFIVTVKEFFEREYPELLG